MSGGIDWFRWHHGSVTDPKFQLVARRAGASLPDVLAVWAYVLETASASTSRGCFSVDAEALDCLFNFPSTETRTADILAALESRGLIAKGAVAAWDKRQPRRERDDDPTATERKRRQRARDAQADQEAGSDVDECHAMSRHVTPDAATQSQVTPREEKRREEKKTSPSLRSGETRARRAPESVPIAELVKAGMEEKTATDFIAHKTRLKSPLTARAWADHRTEAAKAGWSVQEAAEKVMARNWKGFEAKYVEGQAPPHPSRAPPESYRERDARLAAERVAEMTGGLVHARPTQRPSLEVIECHSPNLGLIASSQS